VSDDDEDVMHEIQKARAQRASLFQQLAALDEHWAQMIQDDTDALQAAVDAGEMSFEEFEREIDLRKALLELMVITAEMGPWPDAPDERTTYEAKLIAAWPDACRRAGVPVIEMPTDVLHRLAGVKGRPS
jgi:hypothetical protein